MTEEFERKTGKKTHHAQSVVRHSGRKISLYRKSRDP